MDSKTASSVGTYECWRGTFGHGSVQHQRVGFRSAGGVVGVCVIKHPTTIYWVSGPAAMVRFPRGITVVVPVFQLAGRLNEAG